MIPGSEAEELGVRKGDSIRATSATAGSSMWEHGTAESVNSAIRTRFVLCSIVRLRLSRRIDRIDIALLRKIKVIQIAVVCVFYNWQGLIV